MVSAADSCRKVEATGGFEPPNRGFADLRVKPLHHVAPDGLPSSPGCPSRIRTSVLGSKVRCPTARRRGSGGASDDIGDRGAKKWSGRRDSNPRPSPWQGDALPTEPLPLVPRPPIGGAESQIRTGDTAIFSRVLYQLSYLGPIVDQALATGRRARNDTTGPLRGSTAQGPSGGGWRRPVSSRGGLGKPTPCPAGCTGCRGPTEMTSPPARPASADPEADRAEFEPPPTVSDQKAGGPRPARPEDAHAAAPECLRPQPERGSAARHTRHGQDAAPRPTRLGRDYPAGTAAASSSPRRSPWS